MCGLFPSPCDRPRVIESLRGVEVVDIAAGGAHSACITASGELYTWGKGRYGRLGHGDSEDQLKPKLVRSFIHCFRARYVKKIIFQLGDNLNLTPHKENKIFSNNIRIL